MLTSEWFPYANAMGISWGEFWGMNPRIIQAIADGYAKRIEQQDRMNWLNGHYILSAVTVGVERNLAGKKSKAEYIKEPLWGQMQKENTPMSEKELQKQRELFVEKLKTMKSNYELSHPKKENDKGGDE